MFKNKKEELAGTVFGFHKMKLNYFTVAVIILIAVFLGPVLQGNQAPKWMAPQTADKLNNPIKSNGQSINEGKTLYVKNCLSCHGKKGTGDGPKSGELEKTPGNFTTSDFSKQSDGAIFWKMTEGKKPMPSFKSELSVQQRWNIVNYIREFGKTVAHGNHK